jgi:hypothetical protein
MWRRTRPTTSAGLGAPKSTPVRIDAARVSTAESTWISASRGMLPSGASASGAGTPP